MKPTRKAVPLPVDLAADIDKLVGKRNRSAFMLGVVEREVRKLRLRGTPDETAGINRKSE